MPEHQALVSKRCAVESTALQPAERRGGVSAPRSTLASPGSISASRLPHRLGNIPAGACSSPVLQSKKMLGAAPPEPAGAARPAWAWADEADGDDESAEEAPTEAPEAASSSAPAARPGPMNPSVASSSAPAVQTHFSAGAIPGKQAGTNGSLWVQPTRDGHHLSIECRLHGSRYEIVGGHLTNEAIEEGRAGRRVRDASADELEGVRERARAAQAGLDRDAEREQQRRREQQRAAQQAAETTEHVKNVRRNLHQTVTGKISDGDLHSAVGRGWRPDHLKTLDKKVQTDPVQLMRRGQLMSASPMSASTAQDATPAAGVVQRQLKVDVANPAYVATVTEHLRQLVGDSGDLGVHPVTGDVTLEDRHHGQPAEDRTHGHRLLHSLVQHQHTTTIRETQGADKLSAQPVLPDNSKAGKILDWFKGFQAMRRRGYLTHEARAFVHGATPGKGVDSIVHYDANLSPTDRESEVETPGGVQRQAAPASISLGHELIHADHFHRGTAAYDLRGTPILSARQHTYSTVSRGEATNLEEINTVGLDLLPPDHDFHAHMVDNGLVGQRTYQNALQPRDHDARQVTEQQLRDQLGIPRRAGYER